MTLNRNKSFYVLIALLALFMLGILNMGASQYTAHAVATKANDDVVYNFNYDNDYKSKLYAEFKLPSETSPSIKSAIIADLGLTLYVNYGRGYIKTTRTTTSGFFTAIMSEANYNINELGERYLVADSILTAGVGTHLQSDANANLARTAILSYYDTLEDFTTAYQDAYLSVLKGDMDEPPYNIGVPLTGLKLWNGVITQDFIGGDSRFIGWGGRERLVSFMFNPNTYSFNYVSDFTRIWDDATDNNGYKGVKCMGYPVSGVLKNATIDGNNYLYSQIFEKGYIVSNSTDYVSALTSSMSLIKGKTVDNDNNIIDAISVIPLNAVQYGGKIGESKTITITENGIEVDKIIQNYTRGVSIGTIVQGVIVSQIDVAGRNVKLDILNNVEIDSNGKIILEPLNADVMLKWVGQIYSQDISNFYNNKSSGFNESVLTNKFKDAYTQAFDSGYNVGIGRNALRIWDNHLIIQEFYDGDIESIGSRANAVSIIAYSFTNNLAYVVSDVILNHYKNHFKKIGEPTDNAFVYNGTYGEGLAQSFKNGFILVKNDNSVVLGYSQVWSDIDNDFIPMTVSESDVKKVNFNQGDLNAADYANLTVNELQNKFYAKYISIKDDFTLGIPADNGIEISVTSSTQIIKQIYYGLDGVGLVLMYNKDDNEVYAVHGIMLKAYSSESRISMPMGEMARADDAFGQNAYYQEFINGTMISNSEGTIAVFKNNTYAELLHNLLNPLIDEDDEIEQAVTLLDPEIIIDEPYKLSVIVIIMIILMGISLAGIVSILTIDKIANKKRKA